MWQVAVAAAVAGGSTLLAKRLFSHQINQHTPEEQGSSGVSNNNPSTSNSSSVDDHGGDNHRASVSAEEREADGVFRFSSSGSPSKSRVVEKKKKTVTGIVRRENFPGRLQHASLNQTKIGGGKRVPVRLKRRKTGRTSKDNGSASSKDHTAFAWGLGLGIMYMMSTGKAEVSKLTRGIDVTAKVVHELKSELNKQKSSKPLQLLGKDGDPTSTMDPAEKSMTKHANIDSSTSHKNLINAKFIVRSTDSDYASSVLTEEHQPEGTEMDQLEAELETELLKLPWWTNETCEGAGNITNAAEMEKPRPMTQNIVSYHSGGVSPSELKHKLSDVLIKQQESNISELESELNLAYSKLTEKEAELQALKDCVKRLTEFSLSAVSDEEMEALAAQEENVELSSDNITVSQTAAVGMKRPMAFGLCDY